MRHLVKLPMPRAKLAAQGGSQPKLRRQLEGSFDMEEVLSERTTDNEQKLALASHRSRSLKPN